MEELRDTVRECFPHRSFFTAGSPDTSDTGDLHMPCHVAQVPLMGMPAFDESLRALRSHLVSHRKPLEMGGIFVNGRQVVLGKLELLESSPVTHGILSRHLAGVMELVVAEVQKSQQVNVPSMNRCPNKHRAA